MGKENIESKISKTNLCPFRESCEDYAQNIKLCNTSEYQQCFKYLHLIKTIDFA